MTSRVRSSRSWLQATTAIGWLGPWLAVAALGLWSATPGSGVLILATAGVLGGALWGRLRSRFVGLGLATALVGILAGFGAHRQTDRIAGDWGAYWEAREAVVGERLGSAFENLLRDGELAADALAQEATAPGVDVGATVARVRARHGVSALALYGPSGELTAWDGSHRGRVPEAVQRGLRRYAYGDLPLFGYLYVTAPTGDRGTAVAAILLHNDLPVSLAAGAGDFATAFRDEVGEGLRIMRPDPEAIASGWDLELGDQTLFTVVLDPPDPDQRVEGILTRWRLAVAALGLLGWLFLSLGAPPRLAAGYTAGFTLVVLAAAMPLQEIEAVSGLFQVGSFSLPGPVPMSLGRLAAIALALVTVVAVFPRPRTRMPPLVTGVLGAVVFPSFLAWLGHGPVRAALAEGEGFWIVYQATATILLTLVTGTLLVLTTSPLRRKAPGVVAVVIAALLGAGSAVFVWRTTGVPVWWLSLWGLPVAIAAASANAWTGWQRPLASWLLAGLVAGTATVPKAWSERVEARREVGAAFLDRLAAPQDEALERALLRLGQSAGSLAQQGDEGVDLLYGAWRASGLWDLGEPAWLTLWSEAGIPEEELRVGVAERPVITHEVVDLDGPEPVAPPLSVLAPTTAIRIMRYDRDDARYILRVTLSTGEVLTVAAPPFADPTGRSPLSPLLAGGTQRDPNALTLIPIPTSAGPEPERIRWLRSPEGWRAEMPLVFANGLYHAHYTVETPGVLLAIARATLLLSLTLLLFLLCRAAGRGFLREALPRDVRLGDWVISFRARVTLALFGFFVLANAIFGTLAYRTIAGTSHRAAQVLAERVVEDASGWYLDVGGRMQALARRVGLELLEYRRGELREGSVEELVDLGLYEGWIPMETERLLEARETVREVREARLGSWRYVTAYRRLPDGDVLAAQVPLQAGATAIRSADVAELLVFAVVLGAALSLGLALLVGRALTRPIQALQVASERVGAGNLRLRLPSNRSDEFGSVFRAFNRMVGRLRRARRQLVRTTRRTRAIMEEAAVGMVALDPSGAVTMVNPRAEELIEGEVRVGEPLPEVGRLGKELTTWFSGFIADGTDEAHVELHDGEKRVRVRARRLGTTAARGGTVIAIEDVTDELRTERVLAWGEMARQVAHEVKNPLTPIKLSVQHIRRAWDDRRDDFDDILSRNADAMLGEIDRLAAIAQGFSRFGAPEGQTDAPVTSVDLKGVVAEVMALYTTEGPVRFVDAVPDSVPPVHARVSEMKEVLINLLENARAATGEGGTVRIEAEPQPDGTIAVRVVDDGSGVPEELESRVFEPHFSTRSTGAGLGLAIVRRLVESWGGSVSLASAPGEGTVVTLELRDASAPGPDGG